MHNEAISPFPTGTAASEEARSFLNHVAKTVDAWKRRHDTRRHLTHVSSDMLEDIGINEADRYDETHKFFWEK